MTNTRRNYSAFVPQGDDRRETAKTLVDAARANGIDQRSIQSAQGGFNITEELADVLGGAEDPDDTEPDDTEPAPEPPKGGKGGKTPKTSGNRAEKNKNSEEE